MDVNAKKIDLFTTRVRQMILQYEELKHQCRDLQQALEEQKAETERVKAQLAQAQSEYDSLKTARMLEVTDSDHEAARKRLAKLIRDVDKCITLVSEQ